MKSKLLAKSFNQLRYQLFDKPCDKCGTIISFSKGVANCPRCYNLTVPEQIELHKTQAEEYAKRRKMGFIFLGIFGVLLSLCFMLYI